jgi:hypothetical protein
MKDGVYMYTEETDKDANDGIVRLDIWRKHIKTILEHEAHDIPITLCQDILGSL